ncbi:hypothetical protein MRX96_025928 [Rhipicephalus microplus]
MIKMMIACVAAFLLCWLPLNLFIVVSEQYPSIYDVSGIGYMWFVCHWLAMSHACYNPPHLLLDERKVPGGSAGAIPLHDYHASALFVLCVHLQRQERSHYQQQCHLTRCPRALNAPQCLSLCPTAGAPSSSSA